MSSKKPKLCVTENDPPKAEVARNPRTDAIEGLLPPDLVPTGHEGRGPGVFSAEGDQAKAFTKAPSRAAWYLASASDTWWLAYLTNSSGPASPVSLIADKISFSVGNLYPTRLLMEVKRASRRLSDASSSFERSSESPESALPPRSLTSFACCTAATRSTMLPSAFPFTVERSAFATSSKAFVKKDFTGSEPAGLPSMMDLHALSMTSACIFVFFGNSALSAAAVSVTSVS